MQYKKFFYNLCLFIVAAITFIVAIWFNPAIQSVSAQEYKVDPKCSAKLVTDPEFDCNILCKTSCVDAGQSCPKGNPDNCTTGIDIEEPNLADYVNIFGVNFGPPQEALQNIIRTVITIAFGFVGLAAILYGLYGMIVRSTAADSAEKVEESVKIFRNAIIGVIIAFAGVLIIQVVAMLLGITDNLFDFNITGTGSVILQQSELNQSCSPDGRRGYYDVPGQNATRIYICTNGRWVGQPGTL